MTVPYHSGLWRDQLPGQSAVSSSGPRIVHRPVELDTRVPHIAELAAQEPALAVVCTDCGNLRRHGPRRPEEHRPSACQSEDRADELIDRGANGYPGRAAIGPQPFSWIDAIREDPGPWTDGPEARAVRHSTVRNSGTAIVGLSHCLADGLRQGLVIRMRVAEPCDKDLGRAHAS